MSGTAGDSRSRSLVRRYAAGLSVAGIATAAILTGAAASNAASTTAQIPAWARNATTLDGGTASAAGKMTVTLTDTPRRHGGLRLTSVQYAGASSTAHIKNPALIIAIRPAGPLCVTIHRAAAAASASLASGGPTPVRCTTPGRKHVRFLVLAIRLKLHSLPNFSGKLPVALLKKINAHGGVLGGEALTATLASITEVTSHHHNLIEARLYMQVGMLLGAGF